MALALVLQSLGAPMLLAPDDGEEHAVPDERQRETEIDRVAAPARGLRQGAQQLQLVGREGLQHLRREAPQHIARLGNDATALFVHRPAPFRHSLPNSSPIPTRCPGDCDDDRRAAPHPRGRRRRDRETNPG